MRLTGLIPDIPIDVVYWAAQECSWQRSGEISVAAMIEAWQFACDVDVMDYDNCVELGRYVEPIKNADGIRTCNVRVGNDVKMDHAFVEPALRELVTEKGLSPMEWFRCYEDIHPFIDGNGRTGSILYNWMLGTLRTPIHSPNLWNDYRRTYDAYPLLCSPAGALRIAEEAEKERERELMIKIYEMGEGNG